MDNHWSRRTGLRRRMAAFPIGFRVARQLSDNPPGLQSPSHQMHADANM